MRLVFSVLVLNGMLVVPSLASANITMPVANPDGVKSLYVQSTMPATTTSTTPTLMPGMQLTLPERNAKNRFALVTFNAGTITPDVVCLFGVYAGPTQYAAASLLNADAPVMMATKIPLLTTTQQLQVEWSVYPGSGGFCDLGYSFPSVTLPAFDSLTVVLSAD